MIAELEGLVAREKAARAEAARQLAESEAQEKAFARLRTIANQCNRKMPLDAEEFVMIPVREGGACCGKATPGLLADRASCLAVIVCHPWGPMGGSMWDLNVGVIADIFAKAGVTTLRFNFRTGLDFGVGAAADLRAACEYLLNGPLPPSPPERLLIIGYSYGSLVVSEVAPTIEACSALVLVAPPLGVKRVLYGPRGSRPLDAVAHSSKPKLALIGTHDQFCSKERFEAFGETLRQPAEARVMQGREVMQQCGSGCAHSKLLPIHHMNVFEKVESHLIPWVERTFACKMEELARSDGKASNSA